MQFRVEKAGIVHAGVGKASFEPDQLVANVKAFVDAINRAKPTGAKGTYLKRANSSSTMGLGVKVDVAEPAWAEIIGNRSEFGSCARAGGVATFRAPRNVSAVPSGRQWPTRGGVRP